MGIPRRDPVVGRVDGSRLGGGQHGLGPGADRAVDLPFDGGIRAVVRIGRLLPTQLTLRELQLVDSHGVWLTADGLSLEWSPLKWLERRIHVDWLQVARVHMERAPVGGQQRGGPVSIPHIEVGRFALDRVELGAPLVGAAATVSGRGALQLRSLEDASADAVVRRLDGDGDYTLHLRFDPRQMNGSLVVHEPAGGPLEHLVSLPGLGALSATLTVQGPRHSERVDLSVDAGELRARAAGTVDLTHQAADVEYSLMSAAMAPREDFSWKRVSLTGRWHGPISAPNSGGRLIVDELHIGAGTVIPRLDAELTASAGRLMLHAVLEGVTIPGPQPRFLADDPLRVDASLLLTAAHLTARPDRRAPLVYAACPR